jgi:release factor glutamine methyltransferase
MSAPASATVTVADALRSGARSLASLGDAATLEARVLLQFVTGLDHAAVLRDPARPLSPAEQQAYQLTLLRRGKGEPVAYITGECEFWSLPLHVTGDTLIPRADTELLVERALERIPRDVSWCVADLGTGSGAIAIAIAHERPNCRFIASDSSGQALNVARDNAAGLGISNIEFRQGSWFETVAAGECDLVVSNPPYVRRNDHHLETGDVAHEPRQALIAGADGLDCLRTIIANAPSAMKPGTWLLLEHGFDQGEAVRGLFAESRYKAISSHRDLAGHERVTEARRH